MIEAQASLVAQWMLVGFIHGVMNTDNMAISGETIDYGPCAFMDAFDPATVFSSIDHGGRYAYGNQPHVAPWNLARLAEALLPLLDEDTDTAVAIATEMLRTFPERFHRHWSAGMRAKLGLVEADDGTARSSTTCSRCCTSTRSTTPRPSGRCRRPCRRRPVPAAARRRWAARWREQLGHEGADLGEVAAAMDRVNPVYVPRNHQVEEALAAATAGDLAPFERLVDVVTRPFDERPGLEAYAAPAPPSCGPYQTFCGT